MEGLLTIVNSLEYSWNNHMLYRKPTIQDSRHSQYIPYNGSDSEDHCTPLTLPGLSADFLRSLHLPRFLSKREVFDGVWAGFPGSFLLFCRWVVSGRVWFAHEVKPISYSDRNSVLGYASIARYIPRLGVWEYGCTDIKVGGKKGNIFNNLCLEC